MRKVFAVSTMIALLAGAAVQAVTIQENTVFPDINIIKSQLIDDGTAAGIRDLESGPNDIDAVSGQTFTLESPATVRAITLKSHSTYSESWLTTGNEILDIWIGEDSGTVSNNVSGATNLLTSVAITNMAFTAGNYYTFNLDSDVVLPAGDYSFQFQFQGPGTKNQWFVRRANGSATNNVGGLIFVQTTDGSPVDFPVDDPELGPGDDLVFGLHSTVIGTVPSFTVDPAEVTMLLGPSDNLATGSVDVAYTADSTMDISISISDESHPGSFSVLSTTPQTLSTPAPATTALEFEFDNTVSNLVAGESATGLVTIAWTETGSGITNQTVLPISASTGFAPDANNAFNQLVGNWGNPSNWDLGRVPGALGADRALIQNALGRVCNVETNFTGLFPYKVWIRTTAGTPNTLNVGADLKGSAEVWVGQAAGQYGVLNQTAGTVGTAVVKVGVDGTVASNSYYNLTGGTLELDAMTANRTVMTVSTNGEVVVNGGTLSLDLAGVFGTATLNGGGSINMQSGAIVMPNGVPQSIVYMGTPFAISGGSLNISGQDRFYSEFKVIGDAATIHFARIGTYGTACKFIFELGANGVSTIDSTGGYQSLANAVLVVDGENYTGGSTTINLFKSDNLNNVIAASNITITNFPAGVTAEVTQDQGTDLVTLTITVPGYAGWISEYGLSGTNADWNVDYDVDGDNNFYEYAFGGDPTNMAVKGYVPTAESVDDGGTEYFEYVYVRRIGTETELDYQPQFGTDLVYTNWSGAGVVELPITGTIDADYESVTNRVDMTGKPVGFMQLIVEQL